MITTAHGSQLLVHGKRKKYGKGQVSLIRTLVDWLIRKTLTNRVRGKNKAQRA
jgi:hypothetical protein